MSVFTDDKLKKLKIRMTYNHSEGYKQTTIKVTEIDAILSRLEAAEAVCSIYESHPRDENCGCLIDAWLSSSGKKGGEK